MNPNHDDHGRFSAGDGGKGGGAAAHERVPPRGRVTYPGGNTRPVKAPGPPTGPLSLNAKPGALLRAAKALDRGS